MYPEVPHGAFTFHLLKNMKRNFKKNSKKFKDTFFVAANAYTVKKFEYKMRELDKIDKRLRPYLKQIGYQMDQLICAHAIAIFKEINQDPYQYCSQYYTKEAMVATYKEIIYPLGNEDTWQIPKHIKVVKIHPPEGKIRVGRPKKRRCKAVWEKNKKSKQMRELRSNWT
ncbi:uncharacterized protein LOC133796073 [Humulus lupulus]|uniref:uncharacterized protein LOC133796073 n=1 Tax=Humulus lupulus TaxID=3486 RepID=UPI002B416FED|nr:uncharacterized protein LOC133796073 [Humulus lupulus]